MRRALILGLLGAALLAGSLVFELTRGGLDRDAAPAPAAPSATSPAASTVHADAGRAAPPVAPEVAPSFDIVRVNPDGDTVIAGRAAPGATVTVLEDGRPVGHATADARGEWVLLPTQPLGSGKRALSVEVERADAPPLRSERVVTLDVPTPAPAAPTVERHADAGAPPASGADRTVVEPGNSLWRLALRRYGHGTEYGVIYRANRAQISDPDLIYPGQVFVIPPER